MKLFGYHNDLCDPANKHGFAMAFDNASSLDSYMRMFIASLNPRYFNRWDLYITNDEVEFHEVDHHHLMEEPYGLDIGKDKIQKVPLTAIAIEVNTEFAAIAKRRDAGKARVDKMVEEARTDESAREVLASPSNTEDTEEGTNESS